MRRTGFKSLILASAIGFPVMALASNFDIPAGDMDHALRTFMEQSGLQVFVRDDAVRGVTTKGVKGDLSPGDALSRLLSGTGLVTHREDGAVAIIRGRRTSEIQLPELQLAQATPPPRAAVETVTVTSSKLGGADVQSIPIAITALSQEQLTATQTAGGPDLVKQVPNLTFSKTNFSGYSITIRGIGTQAISVTTDPAVAVAMNDIPFIRNHFFEQEFFDVGQLEVLRGPQGTLYGRNATAGVVNVTTAKPTDQFEAMASGEIGNYKQRRFEGMVNIPIVDDRLDIRLAGEWTKRQGYSFNALTDQRIDGRDLWSGRATVGLKPIANLQTYLIWEHFSENDDRMRSAKQLCKRDPGPSSINGVAIPGVGPQFGLADALSQGCLPASPYAAESYETPNGQSLSFFNGLKPLASFVNDIDPYASTTQSRNLRVIESAIEPSYRAKNDILELNAEYGLTPTLTFASQTGFNHDFLYSTEDYNRFNTAPGVFRNPPGGYRNDVSADGVFCDPQLGCSNRMVGEDLDTLKSWQLNQEFRLTSSFTGPFNFSVGGNFLHYEIDESYYVFINALTLISTMTGAGSTQLPPYVSGVTNGLECLHGYYLPDLVTEGTPALNCPYIDPNPISSLDGNGHNYFRSHNPYILNSYASFGEVYYNATKDLKLIGGVRWTDDRKHFPFIPSFLLVRGWGSYVQQVVDQEWREVTGRAAVNWTPKLSFTDQTLIYGSFAHGYKAGGANPPGAVLLTYAADHGIVQPVHPLTFEPEFINAFEGGTKNTLLDGALTLNGDLFYYDYKNYQISQIVDRTSVNLNVDATVRGAEVEAAYEPIPGLRFNFAGGWEQSEITKGQSAIDLIDRTAGHTDWVVLKPSITQASNCIVPAYVVATAAATGRSAAIFNYGQPVSGPNGGTGQGLVGSACQTAYDADLDPLTGLPFVDHPTVASGDLVYGTTPPAGYVGFNPATAPNGGEGFSKNIGGNDLPNTPPLTVSAGAQYTVPISSNWAATLRGDYYWQDYSWARIFNDNPYDRLRGYTNVNLSLILTSQSGWQVMLYDKNVFNTTDITGAFLNSDDSGLTTNVFTTDPKLIGVRVTKNW